MRLVLPAAVAAAMVWGGLAYAGSVSFNASGELPGASDIPFSDLDTPGDAGFIDGGVGGSTIGENPGFGDDGSTAEPPQFPVSPPEQPTLTDPLVPPSDQPELPGIPPVDPDLSGLPTLNSGPDSGPDVVVVPLPLAVWGGAALFLLVPGRRVVQSLSRDRDSF